ncbi:MAG: hypothetical protein AB8B67_04830 [Rickettsiaceae bacterium]
MQNKQNSEYLDSIQLTNHFLSALVEIYHDSLASKYLKNTLFVVHLIRIIIQYQDLLEYVPNRYRKDFLENIENNQDKYLNILQSEEAINIDQVKYTQEFQENLSKIKSLLDQNIKAQSELLSDNELDVIQDRVTFIIQRCDRLFSQSLCNDIEINKLQAHHVSFNIHQLSVNQQLQLSEKLLLIKELWIISNAEEDDEVIAAKNLLYNDPIAFLDIQNETQATDVANKLACKMLDQHSIITKLTNDQLRHLYDRLKNLDRLDEYCNNLLKAIHQEAPFRYNHNRLNDSAYSLLQLFQSYNSMLYQIENLEHNITDSILFRPQSFLEEVCINIAKNIDNLIVLSCSKNQVVTQLIKTLNVKMLLQNNSSSISNALKRIEYVKSRINSNITPQIITRYSELNKFTIRELTGKYMDVFHNINLLIDSNRKDAKPFLENALLKYIVSHYYIASNSKDENKIRTVAQERNSMRVELALFDIIEMFNPEYSNSISSIDFRKEFKNTDIQSTTDYLTLFFESLMSKCNNNQLYYIYQKLITRNNKNPLIKRVKAELFNQVKQRTKITNIIYSVFSGKRKELQTLKLMSNTLKSNRNLELSS